MPSGKYWRLRMVKRWETAESMISSQLILALDSMLVALVSLGCLGADVSFLQGYSVSVKW